MKADKCWGEGGKGLAAGPKWVTTNVWNEWKLDLYAEIVDGAKEFRTK
jgi:hypothetical protein